MWGGWHFLSFSSWGFREKPWSWQVSNLLFSVVYHPSSVMKWWLIEIFKNWKRFQEEKWDILHLAVRGRCLCRSCGRRSFHWSELCMNSNSKKPQAWLLGNSLTSGNVRCFFQNPCCCQHCLALTGSLCCSPLTPCAGIPWEIPEPGSCCQGTANRIISSFPETPALQQQKQFHLCLLLLPGAGVLRAGGISSTASGTPQLTSQKSNQPFPFSDVVSKLNAWTINALRSLPLRRSTPWADSELYHVAASWKFRNWMWADSALLVN